MEERVGKNRLAKTLTVVDAKSVGNKEIFHTSHPKVPTTDEQKLNKTEKSYLALLRLQGYNPGIQNVTVKLAYDLRYTPDFTYYDSNDHFVLVDTKGGFTREDAWIKAKMAAHQFPRWIWQVVSKTRDGWEIKVVKP